MVTFGRFTLVIAVVLIAGCAPTTQSTPIEAADPKPACDASKISVESINAKFVNDCRRSDCTVLKGVATVVNGCEFPVGAQFQIIATDGSGAALASNTAWLNSTRNLPVGRSVLSLEQAVDYVPGATGITVQPVEVRRW